MLSHGEQIPLHHDIILNCAKHVNKKNIVLQEGNWTIFPWRLEIRMCGKQGMDALLESDKMMKEITISIYILHL
jgi:hypothetical protein